MKRKLKAKYCVPCDVDSDSEDEEQINRKELIELCQKKLKKQFLPKHK